MCPEINAVQITPTLTWIVQIITKPSSDERIDAISNFYCDIINQSINQLINQYFIYVSLVCIQNQPSKGYKTQRLYINKVGISATGRNTI